MPDCQHEWVDDRPTYSPGTLPPSDNNIVQCTKCGAPLQLARRDGMWLGTRTPGVPGFGPPFYYMGKADNA
jgi:hypothetical protein